MQATRWVPALSEAKQAISMVGIWAHAGTLVAHTHLNISCITYRRGSRALPDLAWLLSSTTWHNNHIHAYRGLHRAHVKGLLNSLSWYFAVHANLSHAWLCLKCCSLQHNLYSGWATSIYNCQEHTTQKIIKNSCSHVLTRLTDMYATNTWHYSWQDHYLSRTRTRCRRGTSECVHTTHAPLWTITFMQKHLEESSVTRHRWKQLW